MRNVTHAVSIILACLFVFLAGCNSCGSEPAAIVPDAGSVITQDAGSGGAASNEPKLKWVEFEEALKIAELEDRQMMIYFFATWCPYCKQVDKDIWTNRDVINCIDDAGYVATRVDVDRYPTLVKEFQEELTGIPRTMLATVDDSTVTITSIVKGWYSSPKPFLEVLCP